MGGVIDWFKWLVLSTWISLNSSTASIQVWNTYQLTATFTPENATNKHVSRSSSDTSKVTVNSNWLITAVSEWSATITVTSEYWWYTSSCVCTTYIVHPTWVTLNKSSATVWEWETVQLTATISPSNANNKNVTRSTSNSSIATVSSTWLVTYKADGSCTITATTVDWWYTATCSITCESKKPVTQTFSYTWADQSYTIPYTQCYKLEAWWAGSYDAAWWYASWVTCLTKWTVLRIMVWQSGSTWWTYWFWWASNYSNSYNWWWLSWIFTGSTAITASDSSRALVIWWWAGSCSGRWNWWAWGWLCWCSWWTNWYWTQGWWWTQTGRWSWWNAWAYQFYWWNGSWSYWAWGWWWWRWWNGTAWDSSVWDDKWAGWWSWYVKSWFTSCTLTAGWGKAAQNHWCVKISSV